ncbi:alpha/beta hydrolase [Halalkalibacter akibai]|uniref:alpha/beta hydrolase n=1 Tax=Halalkalibacter akibai TaxID=1411 RepID=UPI00191BD68B
MYASGEGPFPVFIYYHGGGWVLGDLDIVDVPLRSITNSSNALVVSVDYRLAPENKFPTAPEDCYQALQWVASNISSYNGDRNRIAVGGDSAGGNLATVVTQMAKQREGPFISYQVLIYPATQFSFHTQSHLENGENYFLTKSSMIYFAKQYISEKEKNHPYASPLLAPDLTSLPPALIITAEYDPLRDEGEAYANRLKESGVPVQLERYEGMIHGFFWLSGIMDQGKKAIDQIGSILKEHFSNSISHI